MWGRTVNLEEGWPWDEYDEMFCRPDTERYGGTPTVKKWFRRMKPTPGSFLKPAREEMFWRWYLDEQM